MWFKTLCPNKVAAGVFPLKRNIFNELKHLNATVHLNNTAYVNAHSKEQYSQPKSCYSDFAIFHLSFSV